MFCLQSNAVKMKNKNDATRTYAHEILKTGSHLMSIAVCYLVQS